MREKVIIIGGGVAGLTAAHELVERDFEVHVFERRSILGGKAASTRFVPRKETGKDGDRLPAEHGFRFVPGWYRHLPHTLERIPYRGRRNGRHRGSVLDNLVTDPSMIREAVAMALMRRLGIAAPREAPARVFVNGAYAGVYMLVEPVDTVFTARHFDGGGLLFEYRWTYPFYATFPGESLDPYAVLFESRSPGVRAMAELYSPMRELFRTINEAPDGSFDQVNRYLNLARFIRMVGASTFMAEWDGVLGYDGMNNFYLYRVGEQALLIPWDQDQAFRAVDYPLLAGASENVLMRRLLEDPRLRLAYVAAVREAVAVAQTDNWLERELARQYALVHDAALADTFKLATNEEFEQAFADLIAFARRRPAFVSEGLAPLR